MNTLSQRIAAFTSTLVYDNIPDPVQEKSKVSLLHNLGVAIAGQSLVATSVLRYVETLDEHGPSASARLLLSGRAATPESAAFANAALMHARAQDDVYFPGLTHVGAITTPAVLAVGEQLGSTGRDMLTALIAGYEAAGAIGEVLTAERRGHRDGRLDVVTRLGGGDGDRRCLDRRRGVVLEHDPVVADLDEIAVLEILRVRDAEAVDEQAVVARAIFEDEVVLRRAVRR